MQSLRGTLCGALLRCTLCDALVEIGVLSCQRVISWIRLRDALEETMPAHRFRKSLLDVRTKRVVSFWW
jgi:hypothetical protein